MQKYKHVRKCFAPPQSPHCLVHSDLLPFAIVLIAVVDELLCTVLSSLFGSLVLASGIMNCLLALPFC